MVILQATGLWTCSSFMTCIFSIRLPFVCLFIRSTRFTLWCIGSVKLPKNKCKIMYLAGAKKRGPKPFESTVALKSHEFRQKRRVETNKTKRCAYVLLPLPFFCFYLVTSMRSFVSYNFMRIKWVKTEKKRKENDEQNGNGCIRSV